MIKTKQTIVINGRLYDASTGLPHVQTPKSIDVVDKPRVINDIAPRAAAPAHITVKPEKVSVTAATPQVPRLVAPNAKTAVQKSRTLRRSILKKPASPHRPVAQKIHKKVERSHRISRFAALKTSVPTITSIPKIDPDLARQAEELQSAHVARIKRQAEAHHKPAISSRAVKEHLLKQQMENAPDTPHHEVYQAGRLSPKARLASVAATSLALILLGGYLTYINIPNLSIRVAAANAGIDASLPHYQPNGYRIHGPIAYTDGQVTVDYQQNGGNDHYTILQKASDWDPQATLDNYVKPESKNDYQIHSSQGLTVYTYGNKAVWVNGGILHIIDGNAPLSGQQVERIAVSM